jgi:hypothetical protein
MDLTSMCNPKEAAERFLPEIGERPSQTGE